MAMGNKLFNIVGRKGMFSARGYTKKKKLTDIGFDMLAFKGSLEIFYWTVTRTLDVLRLPIRINQLRNKCTGMHGGEQEQKCPILFVR